MAIIVNPQSEMIREPNLLIPGKKPIGQVRLRNPTGCRIEQYVHGDRVLPHDAVGTIGANTSLATNQLVIDTGGTDEGLTVAGGLIPITSFPFGFYFSFYTDRAYSQSGDWGEFSLYKNTSSESSQLYVTYSDFETRYHRLYFKYQYDSQNLINLGVYGGWNKGDLVEVACLFNSTSQVGYLRWNGGEITRVVSTADISSWSVDIDSTAIGYVRRRIGYQTQGYEKRINTAIILSGGGLSEALIYSIFYDGPYQYLVL